MKKDLSNIKKAKYLLDNNHCVAIPTETVYGLAANAYSDKATSKIFKLKKSFKKINHAKISNSRKFIKKFF